MAEEGEDPDGSIRHRQYGVEKVAGLSTSEEGGDRGASGQDVLADSETLEKLVTAERHHPRIIPGKKSTKDQHEGSVTRSIMV